MSRVAIYFVAGILVCYLIAVRGPEIVLGIYASFLGSSSVEKLLLSGDRFSCDLAHEKIGKMNAKEQTRLIPFFHDYYATDAETRIKLQSGSSTIKTLVKTLMPFAQDGPSTNDYFHNHSTPDGCINFALRYMDKVKSQLIPV